MRFRRISYILNQKKIGLELNWLDEEHFLKRENAKQALEAKDSGSEV